MKISSLARNTSSSINRLAEENESLLSDGVLELIIERALQQSRHEALTEAAKIVANSFPQANDNAATAHSEILKLRDIPSED